MSFYFLRQSGHADAAWRVMFGTPEDFQAVLPGRYKRVQIAKLDCIKEFGVNPIRMHDMTEVPFNHRDPLHAALGRIELRATPFEIVAVGKGHYLLRRNTYGPEVPVQYTVRGDQVIARKDSELITS